MPRIAYVRVGCCQDVQHLMPVNSEGFLSGEVLCKQESPARGWSIRDWVNEQEGLRDDTCEGCREAYVES